MRTDQLVVIAGTVFATSERNGDISARTVEGFYAFDTRFLSTYRLTLDGKPLEHVGAAQVNHAIASVYLTNQASENLPAGSFSVVRDRYVEASLHEDISVNNQSQETHSFRLTIAFDADFADIFEVRRGAVRKAGAVVAEQRHGQHLCLVYQRGAFHRETWVSFTGEPEIHGRTAIFQLTLKPKETWKTCVSVLPVLDGTAPQEPTRCVSSFLGGPFGRYRPPDRAPLAVMRQGEVHTPLDPHNLPVLGTEHEGLRRAYRQAVGDLRSLLLQYVPGHYILAAGLPWFMAVFGRDSVISSIQTKLLGPSLMTGTLYTLANLQAKSRNQFRESDPGKIPHEIRQGELSVLERVPHTRYYGSVDATPLFLVLLSEAYQWTGDMDMVRELLPAAEAALRWIDRYGDMDGDGFVEYERRTRKGLVNQGWKDSHDSVAFADGRLAEAPIALAEVQGYVYDAKLRMAQLYRLLNEPRKASRLEKQAGELRQRFNEAFWMPQHGFFAEALDAHKNQVDSITSNPGHCLWSGIVDTDKAGKVVERLMAPDLFSGWGIRTLSSDMARYNPLSYHNGSIWPHDNSLIAAGMARYGFIDEARQVAFSILDACNGFPDNRPPELFAGYARRERTQPIPYPDANAPQAWASGAIIYFIEMLLRVIPSGPRLLQEAGEKGFSLSLRGVRYRGVERVL